MKKLLLILICLFVSFEVKSESDDLSGKKLLCVRDVKQPEGIFQSTVGIEFTSKEHVNFYTYYNRGVGIGTYPMDGIWRYWTSLEVIRIFRDPQHKIYKELEEKNDPGIKDESEIFRQTLKLVQRDFSSSFKNGIFVRTHDCKLFNKDLEKYFKELKDNHEKELKSKQKI